MADALTGLVRLADRWELPIAGQAVSQLCIDYAVTLRLGNDVSIRIEQPFLLGVSDGSEHRIVPESDLDQLAPVLELARATVAQGWAFDGGRLETSFIGGMSVSVPSAEAYESWEIVGPAGLRIVSTPGGELSVWQPDL